MARVTNENERETLASCMLAIEMRSDKIQDFCLFLC